MTATAPETPPHRLRLSRPAAERLLALVGARPPWRAAVDRHRRLDAPAAAHPVELADVELARLGAVTPSGVHPDLVAALAAFVRPGVLVDVDLVVRRPGPEVRWHSWQRPGPDRVASLNTGGHDVEMAWHERAAWPAELSRTPAALAPRVVGGPPVVVPRLLLVATGAALRAGRRDLVDVLARQHAPVPDLGHLHECRARLRVLLTGPVRVRWVGWVLLADGWHELSTHGPDVHLTPVAAHDLGPHVVRLVDGVRR